MKIPTIPSALWVFVIFLYTESLQGQNPVSETENGSRPIIFTSTKDTFAYTPATGPLLPHQALTEVNELLGPLYHFYGHDRTLVNTLDSASSFVLQQNLPEAFELYKTVLYSYHEPSWTANAAIEVKNILDRVQYEEHADTNLGAVAPTRTAAGTKGASHTKNDFGSRTVETILLPVSGPERDEYVKVSHKWGGVYYYLNGKAISEDRWERALKAAYAKRE